MRYELNIFRHIKAFFMDQLLKTKMKIQCELEKIKIIKRMQRMEKRKER